MPINMTQTLLEILEGISSRRSICWTQKGSGKGLSEKVSKCAKEASERGLEKGVIYFEKLPDGGYKIRFYQISD